MGDPLANTLFRSNHLGTVPDASLTRAAILATRIIRSDFHVKTLCSLYQKDGVDHINAVDLRTTVNQNQVFTLERIRLTSDLAKRAATKKEYDPWCIYLNPLLLYEMVDREREAASLTQDRALDRSPRDLQPPFIAPGVRSQHRAFNSIHAAAVHWKEAKLVAQMCNMLTPISPPAKKTRTVAAAAPTVTPTAEIKERLHSDLTVQELNVLMLMILLVHEADHLLHWAHSTLVHGESKMTTPVKYFSVIDREPFTDIGHLMERHLYGFVVNHAYHEANPTPFAVTELLGSRGHQGMQFMGIITPSAALRGLLTTADPCAGVIDEAVLKFSPPQFEFDYDPIFPSSSLHVTLGVSDINSTAKEEAAERKEKAVLNGKKTDGKEDRDSVRAVEETEELSEGEDAYGDDNDDDDDEEEKEEVVPAAIKAAREVIASFPAFQYKH